jgi:hypothetical protein
MTTIQHLSTSLVDIHNFHSLKAVVIFILGALKSRRRYQSNTDTGTETREWNNISTSVPLTFAVAVCATLRLVLLDVIFRLKSKATRAQIALMPSTEDTPSKVPSSERVGAEISGK